MSNGNKRTKKQHYIPQVYLRGFSPDYGSDIKNEKYKIYTYDLMQKELTYKKVPIKSICFNDDFYEVTGVDGNIVLENHLEKFFSEIEKMFSKYRKNLENKAFISDNYNTKCFLTPEEKCFWIVYIAIQILRLPQILEVVEETGLEIWGDRVDKKELKNISRTICLPFFKELEETYNVVLLDTILKPLLNMSFAVGVDYDGKILTSNKVVCLNSSKFPCEEYDSIVFPLSSKICIFMFGNNNKKCIKKNCLFPISESDREVIIKTIVASTYGNIFSNHILDGNEIKYINEVRIKNSYTTIYQGEERI